MDSSSDFKRYIDIAWRRKWWLVVSTVLGLVTSVVLLRVMPKAYRASTTILVTQRGVPDEIVRSTVTLRVEEQMRSLEQQVLSRSFLEQVARKLELLPANPSEADVEAACDRLRAQITPEIDKQGFSWFRISVVAADPARAADIANLLAALFIEQDSTMRATQAAGTLEATESWEAGYRAELTKRENELSDLERQNRYSSPDQQPVNMQLLSVSQNRVAQLTSDFQLRSDRLVALRVQQQADRETEVSSRLPHGATGASPPGLGVLQRELTELLATYTDEHPLVKRKRDQIAELIRTTSPPEAQVASGGSFSVDLRSLEIASLEHELETNRIDRAREEARVGTYRARIDSASQVKPKFVELTRGYDQVTHELDVARAKNEQARHSQDLEGWKNGEQFRIQDRAFPQPEPISPNALLFLEAGLGLGLALGAGAIVAREFVDQTVRGEEEFAAEFPDLPVFVVIPNLGVRQRTHGSAS